MEDTNYTKALRAVTLKGKNIYGSGYHIRPEDEPTIRKLIAWFTQDKQMATQEDISLQKGILLGGPVGCGKTAIMHIFCALTQEEAPFLLVPCYTVAMDYAKKGITAVEQYTTKAFSNKVTPLHICFDDLGFEDRLSHFGDKPEVMQLILTIRYDLFLRYGMITHLTTNLSSDEVEKRYDYRVRSRIRQQFNIITFPPASTDKRK